MVERTTLLAKLCGQLARAERLAIEASATVCKLEDAQDPRPLNRVRVEPARGLIPDEPKAGGAEVSVTGERPLVQRGRLKAPDDRCTFFGRDHHHRPHQHAVARIGRVVHSTAKVRQPQPDAVLRPADEQRLSGQDVASDAVAAARNHMLDPASVDVLVELEHVVALEYVVGRWPSALGSDFAGARHHHREDHEPRDEAMLVCECKARTQLIDESVVLFFTREPAEDHGGASRIELHEPEVRASAYRPERALAVLVDSLRRVKSVVSGPLESAVARTAIDDHRSALRERLQWTLHGRDCARARGCAARF